MAARKEARSLEEKAANRWSGKKTSHSRSLRFLADQVYFCSAYLSVDEHPPKFILPVKARKGWNH
jgi:hypothetical protein